MSDKIALVFLEACAGVTIGGIEASHEFGRMIMTELACVNSKIQKGDWMSQDSGSTDQNPLPRGRRIVVGVGIGVVVVAVLAVVLFRTARPDNKLGLGGRLKIEADPEVEIYIGNQHVGNGPVELTWDELIGTREHRPLATPINHDAPVPSAESMGAITAEILGGEGSQIIWSENVHSESARSLQIASKYVLLRRSNGDLDLVTVIDAAFTTATDSGRCLIPIRLRATKADSDQLACAQPTGWTFHPDIKWVIGLVHSGVAPVPDDFSKEMGNKGLWTPQQ